MQTHSKSFFERHLGLYERSQNIMVNIVRVMQILFHRYIYCQLLGISAGFHVLEMMTEWMKKLSMTFSRAYLSYLQVKLT